MADRLLCVGGVVLFTAKKKVAIQLYMAFLYNAGMPDLSYTTSYTNICERMTFL